MPEQIQLNDHTKERVAFELMQYIAEAEAASSDNYQEPNPRDYYLQLYAKCLTTIRKSVYKEGN